MKHILYFILLCLPCTILSAQTISVFPTQIDSLLHQAYVNDQTVRQQFLFLNQRLNAVGPAENIIDSLVWVSAETERIDKENLKLVKSILKKGWPDNLTKESYETIWLIIDHSPVKQQKKYIQKMEEAAASGDISYQSLATMKDRINMYEGKPQTYGTQSKITITPDGQQIIYIWPIEDAVKLNQLRKEIGLTPIEEYVQSLEAAMGAKTIYDSQMTVKQIMKLTKTSNAIIGIK